MKTSIHKLTAIGATALLTGAVSQAQDNPRSGVTLSPDAVNRVIIADQDNLRAGEPYVSADVGPAFQQDLYIRNLGRTVSSDAGARGDISFGANIIDQLAVELQTGAIASQFRSSGTPAFGGNRAYLDQVPLLGNIIFKAPLMYGITPYIGGGAGGVVSDISVRENGHWTDDSDFTFAWQGMAGVNVALGRHLEVGLGYRLLGSPSHTFFGNDPTMYTPTGGTITHAVVGTFSFIF